MSSAAQTFTDCTGIDCCIGSDRNLISLIAFKLTESHSNLHAFDGSWERRKSFQLIIRNLKLIDSVPHQADYRTFSIQLITKAVQCITNQLHLSPTGAFQHQSMDQAHLRSCKQKFLCGNMGLYGGGRIAKASGIGHDSSIQAVHNLLVQLYSHCLDQIEHQLTVCGCI